LAVLGDAQKDILAEPSARPRFDHPSIVGEELICTVVNVDRLDGQLAQSLLNCGSIARDT
jgi:hypothetical protein